MGFQTAINNNIGFGIPGELFLEGPLRAQPARLNTGTPANNVFGRAFTIVDDATASFDTAADPQPLDVAAGGTGVFAGILANPKEHVNLGVAGNTLGQSLILPNDVLATLVQETAGIIIQVPAACAIGDWVYFSQTTGALQTTAPGAAVPGGTTRVPNGRITRYESAAAGLAVMEMDAKA